MKVLYAGLQNENYNPKRRFGVEYTNFFQTLRGMAGIAAIEYPFDPILELGKKEWNRRLRMLVEQEKPDVLFAMMFTDEFEKDTLDHIRAQGVKTVAWFSDDYWRFFNYSKHWAPHFSYVVTTAHEAVLWYKKAGYDNVILSQWACNPEAYALKAAPVQDIAVSFIGQHKPQRATLIARLEKAGIPIETFGWGWSNGRVSHDEMLSIIGRSKINLNFNNRPSMLSPRVLGRIVVRRHRGALRPDMHLIENLNAYWHFRTPHIHARPFELAGAGGFVISGYADHMEKYYIPDKEMVFYKTPEELIEKARYYLAHNEAREAIRVAGHKRTIIEHTYEKRFSEIFKAISAPYEQVAFPIENRI